MVKNLIEIYNELKKENLILNEVLDLNGIDSYKYNFTKTSPLGPNYNFNTNEGFKVEVFFQNTDAKHYNLPTTIKDKIDKIINISFLINGRHDQHAKIEFKQFLPIIKTIINICKDYIDEFNPDVFAFAGIDKGGTISTDNQKNKVYNLLLKNNLPSTYNTTTMSVFGLDGILAYKKNLK